MADPTSAPTAAETQQRDMRLVADLASQWMAAGSEAQISQGLADGLRQVVGDDAVISVSYYDPKRQCYRPQALTGLGSLASQVAQLLGSDPRELAGDYPAGVKDAMAQGVLVRVEGGVAALAGQLLPEAVVRQGAKLLGLADVYVVGFARGDFRGGVSIITRRPGMALHQDTIEALARIAAVSIESRRTEARLRAMAQVVQLAPSSITVHDFEGRCLFANRATFELHGYEPAELMALSLSQLEAPEDAARMGERLRAIEEKGEALFELRHRRKDGVLLPLEVLAKRVEWQGVPALLGVATDVSERKQAEEERARLEGQLQQAQKMESVGRLAGGVAHDFNNMLGVILAHADVAMTEVDPSGAVHNDLEEIRKAALRSASLTRQLLAFARRQTVSPRVLDLNQTIADMLKMLQRLIGEDLRLQWKPGEGLWPVKVDPSQIDQILANLCVNSRDAITGVGQLTIESCNTSFDEAWCAKHAGALPGEYVRLAVSDDGSGMDKQTLSHLFEPFFTTKGVGKGTGLGLATVYGIVKQNRGFIDATSEPGQGTTFKVYLPRHAGDAKKAAAGGPADAVVRGHETILLVEDEPAILYAVKKMLERLGYAVLAASSAAEALQAARERDGEIELLMTDVVMPEMNGRELARKLVPMRPEIKLLFMSGYTADVIAHHGVLDEGVHFIQKPFSAGDLAAKVRSALGEHHDGS